MGCLSLGLQLPEATRMERGLCSSPLLLLVGLLHVPNHSEDTLLNAFFLIWFCLPSSTQQGCREGTVRKPSFTQGITVSLRTCEQNTGLESCSPQAFCREPSPLAFLLISLQTHLGTSSREEKMLRIHPHFFFTMTYSSQNPEVQ